jgi:hypothetical protein
VGSIIPARAPAVIPARPPAVIPVIALIAVAGAVAATPATTSCVATSPTS